LEVEVTLVSKFGQICSYLVPSSSFWLSEQLYVCETDIQSLGMNHTRFSLKKRPGSTFHFPIKPVLGLQLPRVKGRKFSSGCDLCSGLGEF